MKKPGIIIVLLALCACDAAEDSANKGGSMLKANYDTTRQHLSKWIYRWEGSGEAPPPKMLANSYCYEVQMDILCYEQPREDLGTRLVAYQGSTAYPPGYVAPSQIEVHQEIVSYDVPPPFTQASPETMAKVAAKQNNMALAPESPPRPAGPPKGLMTGK